MCIKYAFVGSQQMEDGINETLLGKYEQQDNVHANSESV